METSMLMTKLDWKTNLQPDLSGNPFLWLEWRWQKDWERKADKLPKIWNLNP